MLELYPTKEQIDENQCHTSNRLTSKFKNQNRFQMRKVNSITDLAFGI